MKKWFKIILGVIGGIVLLLGTDLLCIFTINRPLFAIKKGNESMYKGIFYDTYYCKELSMPQIKAKETKFSCAIKESQYDIIVISDITLFYGMFDETGATLVIKDNAKTHYTYGEWYKIEKKVNNEWYEVKPIIDDYGFDDIAYIPDENGEVKFVIDWEWLYGKLPPGVYRILKQVNNHHIAFEFNIES